MKTQSRVEYELRWSNVVRTVGSSLILLCLMGCSRSSPPSPGPIKADPPRLATRQEATISVWPQGMHSPTVVWSAPRGSFPKGNEGVQVTYRAPDEPGPVNVSCLVVYEGKQYPTNVIIDVVTRDVNEFTVSIAELKKFARGMLEEMSNNL